MIPKMTTTQERLKRTRREILVLVSSFAFQMICGRYVSLADMESLLETDGNRNSHQEQIGNCVTGHDERDLEERVCRLALI